MVTGKSHNPSRFSRFVLYPIAGLLFFCLLIIILTMANGYRFTYSDGRVGLIKTGMLILATRPMDAQISLNGKVDKHRTSYYLLPTRISSLTPGMFKVEVTKAGYRTWSDTLEIKPNMVTWANYILLFAEKLNIAKVDDLVGNVLTSSENGRHILYSQTKQPFALKSIDSNNLTTKDFWPAATPVEPWLLSPTIKAANYSPNSDRVLLTITNGTRNEYVVADASLNPVKLIHLNATLKQDFDNAWWNVANNNELYLQTKAGISLVNLSAAEVPAPILTDVVSFDTDSGRQLFYVTKNQLGTYSVGKMNLDGGNKTVLVESVVPSKSYKLGYSSQNNVLTVLDNDTGELTVYFTGASNKKSSLKLSSDVQSFDWSKDGQFLMFWGKTFVKRYDWEKSKEVGAAFVNAPTKVQFYFDENHYLFSNSIGIYEMDYDGSNVVAISDFPATVSILDQGNNNIIFSAKDASGVEAVYKYIAEF